MGNIQEDAADVIDGTAPIKYRSSSHLEPSALTIAAPDEVFADQTAFLLRTGMEQIGY